MPADDAIGPGGRAAAIGFFTYADDSRRTLADDMAADEAWNPPRAEPVTSRGSMAIVAVATLLLAGTAFSFAWTVTGPRSETADRGPAVLLPPETLPPVPQPAAQPAPQPAPRPAGEPARAIRPPHRAHAAAPPRARAAHLARRHRALTKPPAPKLASHRLISLPRHAAARDTAAAARPASAIADIADLYAQSIRDLDRRQGLAALADPPY